MLGTKSKVQLLEARICCVGILNAHTWTNLFFLYIWKVKAVSPCVLPSSPTLSFRSYWLTTERRQARWQVASSYKPPRAKPLKSFTVSKKTTWRPDFFKEASWHSYIIIFFCFFFISLWFQISSKLSEMTTSPPKAKAVVTTSEKTLYFDLAVSQAALAVVISVCLPRWQKFFGCRTRYLESQLHGTVLQKWERDRKRLELQHADKESSRRRKMWLWCPSTLSLSQT